MADDTRPLDTRPPIPRAELPPAVSALLARLVERGHHLAGFRRSQTAFPGSLTAFCTPCGSGIYVDDEGRRRGGALDDAGVCRGRPS